MKIGAHPGVADTMFLHPAFVALKSYLETAESGVPEFKFILLYI